MSERNYAKDGLTQSEVKRILQAAGSVEAVLNTRHAIAKENGWKERPPSKAAYAAAVAETPNLIRRPILVANGRAVVGNKVDEMRKLLG